MVRLSFAPIPKSDERFARQYRFEPPLEFPLASPCSGIVHHLSSPDRRAPTRTLHRRSGSASGAARDGLPLVSFLVLPRFKNPSTHTHVRLLGLCFKTGWMGSPQVVATQRHKGHALRFARTGRADDGFQRHLRHLGLGSRRGRQPSTPRANRRTSKTISHTTGAHRRPPSASLLAISSTL